MSRQEIGLDFAKDAAWDRVRGRLCVFLDTNCWIDMADEANETACRVRDRLQALVASGKVFCPLSWGVLEELFKQSGESLKVTSSLMEELSLNAIFVMRTELFQWELSRSVRRLREGSADDSMSGLFAPPAAFVGSRPSLVWDANVPLGREAQKKVRTYMRRSLSEIGVVELANRMGGSRLDETPPAYSAAARKAMEVFKGDKKKLFVEEAGNCFRMYITPLLCRYQPEVISAWLALFSSPDDEEAFFLKVLAQLPALHNYIDIMVAVDCQPARKDDYHHFMDNEIVVAPLAYADVFTSKDRGIRDLLRSRTKILSRTSCQYCDGLVVLDSWLTEGIT